MGSEADHVLYSYYTSVVVLLYYDGCGSVYAVVRLHGQAFQFCNDLLP